MEQEQKRKRILVVDDQQMDRLMIAHLMAGFGAVDFAATGEEAVSRHAAAITEGWPYDMICMDVNMSGMLTGNQAVRCIREHEHRVNITKPVAIIMVSAANRREEIELSLELCGADDYVCKPFDSEEIKAIARKHLT
ncbi:response regulator [Geomesophilobacter sediminis]|uniref:Response regulator n=1 Tax=Geomesophilobacter sediminis TaxID=2798584 RepID=A0A8J7JFR7_9BACT|nr:response regulator [Geomesophilobacter sediminis]MBJ6726441.1 response regulator [Geomesophilobacter sediminis]